MKKYFVTLAVTVSVCTQVALANNRIVSTNQQQAGFDPLPAAAKNHTVSSRILCSFQKTFSGATYITWERVKGSMLAQATFRYNNERYIAFFDTDGKLVATSRFIHPDHLPLLIRQRVAQKFAAYNLQQVVELTQNDETTYIATFDNDRIKLEVQLFNGGDSIIKKEKKNFVQAL